MVILLLFPTVVTVVWARDCPLSARILGFAGAAAVIAARRKSAPDGSSFVAVTEPSVSSVFSNDDDDSLSDVSI